MRAKVFLIMLLGGLFMLSPLLAVGTYAATGVGNVEVILQDNVVDRPLTYYVKFTANQTLLGGRDVVTLKFPEQVVISPGIRAENVSVNGYSVGGIDYNDGVLQVMVPGACTVSGGNSVEVGIASSVIRNPREAGYYYVTVSTSVDTLEVRSADFFITDYEYGNGVSKPSVRLTIPADDEETPAYEMAFKTSINGRLIGGIDRIYCEFAHETGLPASIDGRYISVNGVALEGQTLIPSGRTLTLPLPLYLNIASQGQVTINISKEAGIMRPTGSYNTLKIWTSIDTAVVTSFEYATVSAASVAQAASFRVVPSPDGMGAQAAYSLQIAAGYLTDSASPATATGFILYFPNGTGLPEAIAKEQIKINGITSSGVISNRLQREVIFTVSTPLSLQQTLNIEIGSGAGITNPASAAEYKMEIRPLTSQKSWMSGFFTIKTTSSTSSATTTGSGTANPGGTGSTGSTSSPAGLIILRVNNANAVIDGVNTTLDSTPVIVNDVTLVPLRFVSTALGAAVDYVDAGKYATVEDSARKIVLWVDSRTAKVNDDFQMMTQPATIINDRLMVPLRFISESFGLSVSWDAATQTITITKGQAAPDTSTVTAEVVNEPEAEYPIGYKAYIKAGNSYCNLRLGPGLDYSKVGEALPGQALTVVSEQDGWYRIETPAGLDAWIAGWMVDIPRG